MSRPERPCVERAQSDKSVQDVRFVVKVGNPVLLHRHHGQKLRKVDRAAGVVVNVVDHLENFLVRRLLAHRLQHSLQLPLVDRPATIFVVLQECVAARVDLFLREVLSGHAALYNCRRCGCVGAESVPRSAPGVGVINRPEEGREKAENQKEGTQIVTGEFRVDGTFPSPHAEGPLFFF